MVVGGGHARTGGGVGRRARGARGHGTALRPGGMGQAPRPHDDIHKRARSRPRPRPRTSIVSRSMSKTRAPSGRVRKSTCLKRHCAPRVQARPRLAARGASISPVGGGRVVGGNGTV